MAGKKYILDTQEERPRFPWYSGRYRKSKLDRVDTSPWRNRKKQDEKEGYLEKRRSSMRQRKGFKMVASQIRTGNKLTYGIIATLKGKLLVKCDLPKELQVKVNRILDWTLPYEPKPRQEQKQKPKQEQEPKHVGTKSSKQITQNT